MPGGARGGRRTTVDGKRLARDMIARADAARDAGQHIGAALLYGEALRLDPVNAGIHVQCGHMFKEAGEYTQAEEHYAEAARLMPDDADLALQLGHFHKVTGHIEKAERAYRRALALKPGWAEPRRELGFLRDGGWRDGGPTAQAAAAASPAPVSRGDPLAATVDWHIGDGAQRLACAGEMDAVAPEVVPRRPDALVRQYAEGVVMRHFGLLERSFWGTMPTLRGVQAIRGFVVSALPVTEIQLSLNGLLVHRGPLRGSYGLEGESEPSALRKYVFNVWCDVSGFAYGRYGLLMRFIGATGEARTHEEAVVIAAPRVEGDHPSSDAVVSVARDDARSVDAQVNARPSMVREARRSLFATPPRTILVQRADQLGDMVCSVPALRRLREIFPDARIVGVLSPTNHELARSLGLFDEIVVADFPDDPVERRRLMPIHTQVELRKVLQRFAVDLAIDMSDSGVSRPLLFLSGAPFKYGFRHGEFPWLSAGFEGVTRDPANGLECAPHTNKLMGLIEWLGVLHKSHARIERRAGLDPALLAPFGLAPGDRFVLLHTGARLAFSRWPGYRALAAALIARTDLKVVMLTDDAAERAALPDDLARETRFILVDQRLGFDAFDALASFCTAFVGNDSGPKHLASLRGAAVVSLHMARNNWNEWGQENRGLVISRKVPCAGCSIHHEPEECGKDFVCIAGIKVDEVFDAVMRVL